MTERRPRSFICHGKGGVFIHQCIKCHDLGFTYLTLLVRGALYANILILILVWPGTLLYIAWTKCDFISLS